MNHLRIQIFQCQTISEFIRHAIDHELAANPGLSIRRLAQSWGVRSAPLVHMMASGQRIPTQSTLLDICRALDLDAATTQYVEDLASLARAGSDDERLYFEKRLEGFRALPLAAKLEGNRILTLKHLAVLEAANLKNNSADPESLAQRIPLIPDASEAEAICRDLVEGGLLSTEDGCLRQVTNNRATSDGILNPDIRKLNAEILVAARSALEETCLEDRIFNGMAFAISKSDIAELRALVKEFLAKSAAIHKMDAEQVYYLGVHLFPLSIED